MGIVLKCQDFKVNNPTVQAAAGWIIDISTATRPCVTFDNNVHQFPVWHK